MKEASDRLLAILDAAEPKLRKFVGAETTTPILKGGWSRKQVVGHLIDSASNNHQRFARAALQDRLEFPGYDQDGFVRVQDFQAADWLTLVNLWAAYNRFLAHVIANLPAGKLETLCVIGTAEPVTLKFIATDYLDHLLHHLRQIGVAD